MKLYETEAAYLPQVTDELDTQNFEKFEESSDHCQASSKTGPWRKMLSSKDLNFVGYTYKNFELVNDDEVLEMGTVFSTFFMNNYVCLFHCWRLFGFVVFHTRNVPYILHWTTGHY